MSNVSIQNRNDGRKEKVISNLYQNVTSIELEESQEGEYIGDDEVGEEYVAHENKSDENKDKDDHSSSSIIARNNQSQKYDKNNIYLQQIPQRNKCSIQIQEGDAYENEQQLYSDNPSQAFVALAKRKSHGRYTSFCMPLYEFCTSRSCLWLVLGLLLTILILSAISAGYYFSPRRIRAGKLSFFT